MSYAELLCQSAFSFLEGASHPQSLVETAHRLGYSALGIADRNSVAGVVRAHVAAREAGLRLLVGARLILEDAPDIICYPTHRAAWGRLTRLLSLGKSRAPKGECLLRLEDVLNHAEGQVLIIIPPRVLDGAFTTILHHTDAYVAAIRRYAPDDSARLQLLHQLAGRRLLAGNDVLYHDAARRELQDVMRCIRFGCTLEEAGFRLEPHGERHLKSPAEMARLFRVYPEAILRQREILDHVTFSLDEISYEYPDEPVPPDLMPDDYLAALVRTGAAKRYPGGVPEKVVALLEKERNIIAQLNYARYFLTVHDIVRYARDRGILCQGRGSAANSAVCYALGITAVDPAESDLLFERFISAERSEPPDIDVDFEHERREEVIQYIYERYGRHRAALAATIIHYRPRSAIREVAKVFSLPEATIDTLAAQSWNPGDELWGTDALREAGLAPDEPRLRRALLLARDLVGLPRHLSQHVGGFVLTHGRLDESVPIGPAAMAGRSFIEWDKDDISALKMMKVDVLALGMLTCIRKCFALVGIEDLADIPREDKDTYDMLSRGDSIGVFQVESRAQMNMLPRLRPQTFYDLVIEVAIVRPGPIQGDMVHPYLRRRQGKEQVTYPVRVGKLPNELQGILDKTLGVPLFQEQAMKIAMVAAEFTGDEANKLRRAMATFRHIGTIQHFRDMMVGRMVARGYNKDFAEACFRQVEGFGSYGFPESHAASFALLVYVSAWLKCHHPAAFASALINAQPMGFYAPAQIIRDVQAHGVRVLPVDVNGSGWDCTLEGGALRLGLRLIEGFQRSWAEQIAGQHFDDMAALEAVGLPNSALEALAAADALTSLIPSRRQALWQVITRQTPLPLAAAARTTRQPDLPLMNAGEEVVADYRTIGLSLRGHPCALLRAKLTGANAITCAASAQARNGEKLRLGGVVIVRQRPSAAKGTVFITIEDETGIANLIVWPSLVERLRQKFLVASLLIAEGRLQRSEEGITHLTVERLADRSTWLAALDAPNGTPPPPRRSQHPRHERIVGKSRDFH
ncbi:error-prone DNA polymerase [Acidocella sp.]|uniref:error-prone DNA polymerase n=1 Tax=Acidocella sp. TaxID=50710 RepID=UPI002639D556|nr:error-prone DNA polymerase [Acidocella sp.]